MAERDKLLSLCVCFALIYMVIFDWVTTGTGQFEIVTYCLDPVC